MNILVITDNNKIISILKDIFDILAERYNFEFLSDLDSLNFKLDNTVEIDVIILDYKFFDLVIKNQIHLNQDDIVNYPILLLFDDFQPVNIDLLKDLKISSILPVEACKNFLIIQLELIYNVFQNTKKIRYRALRDPLTQLFNRDTWINSMKRHFLLFHKQNIPFCLGMIDLDHFKYINDSYGHLVGDEVLSFLASIMRKKTRSTDILARIGGEEFAIIFPDTSLDIAYNVMERIRKGVLESDIMNKSIQVTLSGGVAIIKDFYNSYEDLVKESDVLLYESKKIGRNKISK